jgi:cytoskeletal protein RodZ
VSTVIHPTGPQSPGVYWFRRAVVLVVLLALLLGVRWLVTGRGGGTPEAAPTTSSSPSSTPTAGATTASSTPSATATSAKPTASATKASPTTTATGVKACAKSQIAVTASTDAASYAVGSTPRLRMKIQNTSTTACTRDIGAPQNELLITSGTVRVWSSDDCNPGGSAQVVTMQPGQSYSVSVTWLGRLSKKGCPANQPLAAKGTYKLTGRNGDVTSAPATFALT